MRSGASTVALRQHQQHVLILGYHNIVPAGEEQVGDRSLHLPQDTFARQLDALQVTHDIVALGTALTRGGIPNRPRAVITFDDAYVGAMTAGVMELQRRQLPATVFVPPAYLGGEQFWWDSLTPAQAHALPAEVRDHSLLELCGREADIREWAVRNGMASRVMPIHATCASEELLWSALSYPLLTVGSHTWSHPNLAALTRAELQDEMTRSRQWLERFGTRALPMIAYPYGLTSVVVPEVAQAAGYTAGFMIEGGWADPETQAPFLIPRLNIPAGVSIDGFRMRTSGLLNR